MKRKSQNQLILNHLRERGPITSIDAFRKYKITRLSGRIFDLRKQGHDIRTLYEYTEHGTRYGIYVLKEAEGG